MRIFDMHVHAENTPPSPKNLLERLALAGVYGCSVISNQPLEMDSALGTDFDTRQKIYIIKEDLFRLHMMQKQ